MFRQTKRAPGKIVGHGRAGVAHKSVRKRFGNQRKHASEHLETVHDRGAAEVRSVRLQHETLLEKRSLVVAAADVKARRVEIKAEKLLPVMPAPARNQHFPVEKAGRFRQRDPSILHIARMAVKNERIGHVFQPAPFLQMETLKLAGVIVIHDVNLRGALRGHERA